jgi:hypothetical protein
VGHNVDVISLAVPSAEHPPAWEQWFVWKAVGHNVDVISLAVPSAEHPPAWEQWFVWKAMMGNMVDGISLAVPSAEHPPPCEQWFVWKAVGHKVDVISLGLFIQLNTLPPGSRVYYSQVQG